MTRVWIAQCLCPQRHAILAAAREVEERPGAEIGLIEPLRTQIKMLVGSKTINPWCGLCKAPIESWRYELNRTPYTTMAEAQPMLMESQREQAEVRRIFGDG